MTTEKVDEEYLQRLRGQDAPVSTAAGVDEEYLKRIGLDISPLADPSLPP